MSVVYCSKKLPSNRKNDVQDRYWLPSRKASLCRLGGLVFLLAALAMIPIIAFAGITPGASPYCGGGDGCVWRSQPLLLLDEEDRLLVGASPAALRRFDAHVARPAVRMGLAGVAVLDTLPFALLLFGVGAALRRLGGRGAGSLPAALRWLRLASLAAIIWALAQPFHETAVETLLSPGTPSGSQVKVVIYLGDIAKGLLLALAAYAAVWAIEAGLRAQRDLDDFV